MAWGGVMGRYGSIPSHNVLKRRKTGSGRAGRRPEAAFLGVNFTGGVPRACAGGGWGLVHTHLRVMLCAYVTPGTPRSLLFLCVDFMSPFRKSTAFNKCPIQVSNVGGKANLPYLV